MNDFLDKVIIGRSKATNVTLSPHHYTPHALRTEGATDLARLSPNMLFIQQFGRRKSEEWKRTYIELDFQDLAKLRGETITTLRELMKHSVE